MLNKAQIYGLLSILILYIFFINKVVADSPATPDPTIIPFPKIMINEVSFKNTEHDWIEILAIESGSIQGMKIFDDGAFIEIENNIQINSGDFILIYFKADEDLIGYDDDLLIIQDAKSGLTGTTEQVVIKNPNNEIVDMVCWRNSSPTSGEVSEFEEFASNGGWAFGNIESCINSDQVLKTDSIARKDSDDTNSPDDWEILNIPTPGTKNFSQEASKPEPEEEILPEVELPELVFDFPEPEEEEPEPEQECEAIIEEEINKNICEKDIMINEVYPNPKGKDNGQEWIELINIGNEKCSLEGWQIDDEEDGSKPYTLLYIHEINSNGFIILPSWQTKINLNNSDDSVRLFNPEENLIDEIIYKETSEDESFASAEDGFVWTKTITPLTENLIEIEEDFEEEIDEKEEEEEKKEIVIPNGDLSNQIKINEIFPNPEGSDKGKEWIEIVNESDEAVNLGNWTLDTGENTKTKYIFPNRALEKQMHLLINDAELGFSLKNSNGKVRLLDFQKNLVDEIEYEKSEENSSFSKINFNESDDYKWEWTSEITPGEENPKLYIYEGEIIEINDKEAYVSLKQADSEEQISIKYIDDGTSMYGKIFKKGAIISATTNSENILDEFKIISEPPIENHESFNYSYIIYFLLLCGLGVGGYFGIKKFNLIKFVNA
ncbi:lamin tail domain-containing protein [Patescibacteria group bacterium]